MSYRDLLDTRVVVRQPAGSDARPELPGKPASLHHASRPPRDVEGPPVTIAGDAPETGPTPGVILVKSGFRHVAIRVREILYVESARNYVRIYLETGKILKSRVPIDRLARHLGTERFLRIHRGRLVNVERVRSVRPLTGGRLELSLSQGSTIVVARDRRRVVLAELAAVSARRT